MPRQRITLTREQAELAHLALQLMVSASLGGATQPTKPLTIEDVRAMMAAQNRIVEQLDVP